MMKTFAIPVLVSILFVAQTVYADHERLFFVNIVSADGFIERLNPNGAELKSLLSTGDGARGIAVDPVNGEIFWSDVKRRVISKINFNGKNQKDIVTTKLDFPADVDIENGKIYWSDQSKNQIGRANLDGTNRVFIVPLPCSLNVGFFCTAGGNLAIDSVKKKLYWTTAYCSDNSCSTPSSYLGDIVRSGLDGSNIKIVVTAVGRPSSIQIDPVEKKIYWTDYVNDVVRRCNLDGTEVEDLFAVGKNNNPNSLALDLKNGYVYWDQDGDIPNRSCLKRMRLNGKDPETIRCGFGNLADIEFVQFHNQRPDDSEQADTIH
ncbi:hypothetical protein [Candidatus Methylobacter oryzae]|nr:hypothetical protein [Candidatus Methylobacter oryzae]